MKRIGFFVVFGAVILMVGFAQEVPLNEQYGIAQQSSTWATNLEKSDRIPGIDQASITNVKLLAGPPEGVPFVIWTDSSNGPSGGGGGRKGGASYKAEQRTESGERFEIHAETTDGKTGTLTIAKKEYDLAKGRLFCVSTKTNPPKVQQIEMDVAKFPRKMKEQIQLAKTNKTIRDFWTKQSRPTPKKE